MNLDVCLRYLSLLEAGERLLQKATEDLSPAAVIEQFSVGLWFVSLCHGGD